MTQFTDGQVLTAAELNAALAAPTITGGSITGAPISGSTGSFSSVTNTSLTANGFTYPGAGGLMESTAAATNGQLLIGSTGNAPVAATITGAANQVSVANGPGSVTLGLPSALAIPGTVSSYDGIATAGFGLPIVVATVTFSNLSANNPLSTLYTVPAGQAGWYFVMMSSALTTAAGTSSTLPQTTMQWTDARSSGTPQANIGATSAANNANAVVQGVISLYAKAGTAIAASTTGYAATPSNSMLYQVNYIVVYLGA